MENFVRRNEKSSTVGRQQGDTPVGRGVREKGMNVRLLSKSSEHRYLLAREPGLVECLTERQSLSPHHHCPPKPAYVPDGEIQKGSVCSH